jgi:hypothetical protein
MKKWYWVNRICNGNRFSVTFDVLAMSSHIKELVPNVTVIRGKTWELVSRDRSFHSFRRQSLKKRKQRRRQLADDTIQSSQVIKMVFTLRRSYRVQERLGYDISRFYLITRQQARERNRGEKEEKWKIEDPVDDLARESILISYCQFSRLLSYQDVRFWRQQTKILTQSEAGWTKNPGKINWK